MKSVLVGITFFVALGAAAQQPQEAAPIVRRTPQIPTITVESRLVPVAVNVVDEKGVPVPGLTVDDFEVKEDDKPQKIAVFDKESTTPLSIVLAIDASESVFSDEHLEREAAKKFVRTILRPQDQIDLMEFDDTVRELTPFTNRVESLDDGLGRMTRGDATAMYDAIYLASDSLQATKSNGGRRVIVMITDGEDTTHHGSYPSSLEEAQRAGAMIYALIIVPIHNDAGRNTGGEHALIQMANDTGGKYFYVEDRRDLGPAFQHVSDDLRTQYTLGYYAPQRGGDSSGFRHIQIQLKDPAFRAKYTLRYRTGYYSGKK
ncbi:MAG TPA: VWA domain-containing protein [Acidobacteriaceae bacterium]|nr:VWA domain-containing protein [Acidobacteriaceae bacterium]